MANWCVSMRLCQLQCIMLAKNFQQSYTKTLKYSSKFWIVVQNLGQYQWLWRSVTRPEQNGWYFPYSTLKAFSWMGIIMFFIKFHWILLLCVQLTIGQHCCSDSVSGLAPHKWQSITLTVDDPLWAYVRYYWTISLMSSNHQRGFSESLIAKNHSELYLTLQLLLLMSLTLTTNLNLCLLHDQQTFNWYISANDFTYLIIIVH